MEYTIGEAAKKTNLSISTIRYYDKEGLLPFLERNPEGIRIFSDQDLDYLLFIKCLKATNMPIKDIKQFFDWFLEGDSTLEQRRELFYEGKQAVKSQIEELQNVLDTIEYKCWVYDVAVNAGTLNAYKSINSEDMPQEIRRLQEKNK